MSTKKYYKHYEKKIFQQQGNNWKDLQGNKKLSLHKQDDTKNKIPKK